MPLDDATRLAMRLIIDGYVVVPDVVVGDELAAMRAAFEREAARRGVRAIPNDDIAALPEFARFLGHPRLMPVIDAFMRHFGHEPVAANLILCRDVFDPAAPPPPPFVIPTDNREVVMHNDGAPDGKRRLSFDVLSQGCACLLYMDDTTPDAGSIIQAVGSHHLSRRGDDGGVVSPPLELVQDVCEVRFVGVKAGSVAIQRAFNWHAAGPPPRSHRRQLRTDYTPKALYDRLALDGPKIVHARFDEAVLTALSEPQRKYVRVSAGA